MDQGIDEQQCKYGEEYARIPGRVLAHELRVADGRGSDVVKVVRDAYALSVGAVEVHEPQHIEQDVLRGHTALVDLGGPELTDEAHHVGDKAEDDQVMDGAYDLVEADYTQHRTDDGDNPADDEGIILAEKRPTEVLFG